MNFKAFVFLGFLFAALLLISSASQDYAKKADAAEQSGDSKFQCYHGHCCRWGLYGTCLQCCSANADEPQNSQPQPQKVDEAEQTTHQPGVVNARCPTSCCAWGRFGCLRCCGDNEEPRDTEAQPQNVGVGETNLDDEANHGGGHGRKGGGGGKGKGGGGGKGGDGKGSGGGGV